MSPRQLGMGKEFLEWMVNPFNFFSSPPHWFIFIFPFPKHSTNSLLLFSSSSTVLLYSYPPLFFFFLQVYEKKRGKCTGERQQLLRWGKVAKGVKWPASVTNVIFFKTMILFSSGRRQWRWPRWRSSLLSQSKKMSSHIFPSPCPSLSLLATDRSASAGKHHGPRVN